MDEAHASGPLFAVFDVKKRLHFCLLSLRAPYHTFYSRGSVRTAEVYELEQTLNQQFQELASSDSELRCQYRIPVERHDRKKVLVRSSACGPLRGFPDHLIRERQPGDVVVRTYTLCRLPDNRRIVQ